MSVLFTSDTHYSHANVLKYTDRPYKDADEMDEAMITNWNQRVRPGDLVYHLGDFALTNEERAIKIAKRLVGQKYLIFGNHDKRLRKSQEFLDQWIWARDYAEISVEGQKIILLHYAMRVWNGSHRGSWHLFGHSHGSLKDDPHALSLDVGVDCWGCTPVSFSEIKLRMAIKTWQAVDHHGARDFEQDV